MSALPEGWASAPIGDLCALRNGRAFKSTDWGQSGVPIVRIQNLNNPKAKFNYFNGDIDERYHLHGGELLFAWSGTPGTSFGAHVWRGGEAVLNQHIFRVDFDQAEIEKRFFRFAINQKLDELIDTAHGGAGLQHVTKGKFEGTKVWLPPFPEQKRIADKLHSLLSRVDAVRVRLDRVPMLLKRFRQSVLAAATSGALTEDWRGGKGMEWKETTLGSCGLVSGGLTKNSKRHDLPLRKKYLRVANVYANRLELDDVAEIGLSEAEHEKTKLASGDLLIVEGNGSLEQLGRVAIWSGAISDCSHQNHLIRWRSGGVEAKWVLFWLLSPVGRQSLTELASTTTGLHTLSISKVSAVPVGLPPPEEQAEIIRRVEAILALADKVQAQYEAARDCVDKLVSALLAKAFRGELASQDPNDEPAAKLLERLRASKANELKQVKRGRKSSATVRKARKTT